MTLHCILTVRAISFPSLKIHQSFHFLPANSTPLSPVHLGTPRTPAGSLSVWQSVQQGPWEAATRPSPPAGVRAGGWHAGCSLGSHALRLEMPSLISILLSKHAQNLGPRLCCRFKSREELFLVCIISLLQSPKQNPPLLTDPSG